MKRQLHLLLASMLFTSISTAAQCANAANIYSFSYGGKTYEVVKEMKTWANAAACAVERGGYLVEINDANEQAAVYNAIIGGAGVSPTYTTINNGGGIAYVWIGATDQANEGMWLWDGNNDNSFTSFWMGQGANGFGNGVTIDSRYNNWGGTSTGTRQEPDDFATGQDYGAIGLAGWPAGNPFLGIAGEWNDIIGSSLLYFVIEKQTGLGLNSETLQSKLKISPNPATNSLLVEGQDLQDQNNFVIYDCAGKVIIKDTFLNNNKINVQSLANGLYFLKIEGVAHSPIKFIKQ
ncbi:MAG TPA: T9SS type A sorting domain-containing protein [Flavobacterium sp.]|nr:T9SS type A sorting domain-containing protein [Flavobacterium sp.]